MKFQFMNVQAQIVNVFAGILTFYLVATAWSAARRKDGETGIFDWGALLAALAVGAGMMTYGLEAAHSQTGLKFGYPAALYFVWASVALLSAAGDVRMLVRGGVFGAHRIVRHLWRMGFALFVAAGSFFLGQQKVFPVSLRGAKVWFVPAFLPLILMIFWLFRVWFTKEYKRTASSYQAHTSSYQAHKGPVAPQAIPRTRRLEPDLPVPTTSLPLQNDTS